MVSHALANAASGRESQKSFLPTDAITTINKAFHHELIAIRLNQENRQYRRFASIQSSNLAGHWEQQNEHTQAAESKAMAIQHRQFIIEHGESLYDDQHQLGHYWLDLGSSFAEAHRDDEAENAYRTSTEQFRELVEQFGRKPHDLCMLADVHNRWSLLMEKREDLDRAKLYLEQAMVHEQDALRSEPSNADHRKTLVEYQARLDTLNQSLETP
jgi:tetratricopeptide (TPR) repeat protein